MPGRKGRGPDSTIGVEASGREQAVWVGIDWGFHQCRQCTPLPRGAGSQSPRALGPWAELWPQKGGLREEGATGERLGSRMQGCGVKCGTLSRRRLWRVASVTPEPWSSHPHPQRASRGRQSAGRAGCWGAGTHGFTRVSRCQAVGLEDGWVGFRAGEVGVAGCCQGRVSEWGGLELRGTCGRVGSGTPWGRGLDRPRDDVFFEMGVFRGDEDTGHGGG